MPRPVVQYVALSGAHFNVCVRCKPSFFIAAGGLIQPKICASGEGSQCRHYRTGHFSTMTATYLWSLQKPNRSF